LIMSNLITTRSLSFPPCWAARLDWATKQVRMIERRDEHCQGMLRTNESVGKTIAIRRLTSAFLKANLKIVEVVVPLWIYDQSLVDYVWNTKTQAATVWRCARR